MSAQAETAPAPTPVDYQTEPSRYRHWKLKVEGRVATLLLDIDENSGIRPGYTLKLNSYDLGVDIELADAVQRIRFEHPQVGCVVITSAKPRTFCSGANIYMLGLSSHGWKVNFCKFTNETRNGLEDSSRYSGLKFLAALNGATAGGGYELALACDEILLVDDRSSAVSLPEVPLLGVLPGTGGLTRLTDKRRVRRDHADILCTTAEGVRGEKARQWRLVDGLAKPQQFASAVAESAARLARTSQRPSEAKGVKLGALQREIDERGYHYRHVEVTIDRAARQAKLLVRAPSEAPPQTLAEIHAQGAAWWPLAMARELDDAILNLRTRDPEIGLWLLCTEGHAQHVLAADQSLATFSDDWLVRETQGFLRRTLARLEVSSRSMFALATPDSCFAGTLLEILLAADRSYALRDAEGRTALVLSAQNFGAYPMVNGQARLAARFDHDAQQLAALRELLGQAIRAEEAQDLGLITAAPDDIDWEEEIRIACEERASLSPDALTGMEASLRFGPGETMESRIFGRLTAWQNWIFIRPNATGERGALSVYGSGNRPQFDRARV
ncbi:benzoyl-CoA-dihydrodiol lyase [Burkholderiales bacterium]|nr:benzoyl-CoA-dihydrodiol lyase [Burkholderiales bacterium]